ncbi:MAG: transglycosylase SLT domain-containing protein [Wenzhouxiangella sp.]|jgi:membrane-bound lytic murein transglycosylase MltF|nr:transglycosylase SLT domain-containing protein [Wenzhouxiangella sp.]
MVLLALLLAACGSDPDEAPTAQKRSDGLDELALVAEPLIGTRFGDLDEMIEQRQIRALVPYSRTFFFIDAEGSQRGLSHAYMEAFENHLNESLDSGLLRVRVMFVPVTRDRLIPWLLEGRGDVIVANLTATPARSEQLLFTEPVVRGVREILISGPEAETVDDLEDLAGRRVYVRPASSFFDSLSAVNDDFMQRGLEPIRLEPAPAHFEVGEVLEIVNAGVMPFAVADDYLAEFWQRVLPEIYVHPEIVLRSGADIAFAVRPESVRLKQALDAFLATHRAGTLFGNITFERFLEDTRWVMEEGREARLLRFRRMARLFQRYGDQYDLDWLLLIAQGYQESRLDQEARSPAGAIGVMQLLPTTAAEMDVGDISELENNIHAGARYLRWTIDRYYADAPMDADNRLLFALASYNAGPRRVREMRSQAEAEGLDPNRWFDNVEYVAARVIGRETVDYVSNIFKYHVAFRLIAENEGLGLQPVQAVD